MRVPSTEVHKNFSKYMRIASDLEDVIVTLNGKDIVKMTNCEDRPEVREEAINFYFNREGKITYQEFLELVENSDLRYEYIDGEVYCLASPTVRHQIAIREIIATFHDWFKGKKCQPLFAPLDVTLFKSEGDINVVQPDVMVLCDLDKIDEKGKYWGVPTLLVEVLSDSTRKRDLEKKLDLYKETGVREYWMVDPAKKEIYLYSFENLKIKDQKVFTGDMIIESMYFKSLKVSLPKMFQEW